MKRIYLLTILFVAAAANVFAQRSVDLRLTHYFAKAPSTSTVLMKDGDNILSSSGGEGQYNFSWVLKNMNAAGGDSLKVTDTPKVKAYYGTTYKITMGASGFPTFLKPTDSFGMVPSSGAVTLNPSTSITSSGTSSVQWCDSSWITIPTGATGGQVVTDPNLANNKTCNAINLTSWVTNVGIINAGVQGLVLFPNPATHKLNLAYDFGSNNSGFVTVTDITGKVVYTQDLGKNISGAQKIQLNINDLNSGAYFLQLQTADKREYSKFIIQ